MWHLPEDHEKGRKELTTQKVTSPCCHYWCQQPILCSFRSRRQLLASAYALSDAISCAWMPWNFCRQVWVPHHRWYDSVVSSVSSDVSFWVQGVWGCLMILHLCLLGKIFLQQGIWQVDVDWWILIWNICIGFGGLIWTGVISQCNVAGCTIFFVVDAPHSTCGSLTLAGCFLFVVEDQSPSE